ncbi:YbeD family protein [Suttonella ornithocola]|uniref:Uncharacterized conserved protein n=1 Tax=Suttonella ornithocola TaxID=279832 RepID=A0A380MPD7_9GAMM|nr:DUF493 domain-containing protein [Suttonella ornithocola]SUO94138.1 Uncharacterized conserved protein [Suttonella ornithocola]
MTDEPKNHPSTDEFSEQETLIEFPARFPIKIMGKNTPEFQSAVLAIINQTIPEKDRIEIREQPSKNGAYLAITVVAMFYDKPTIDNVYQALTDEPLVLMAL